MSAKNKKIKLVAIDPINEPQRRHHNRDGRAGKKSGRYYNQLKRFAKINGIPFGDEKK
jgi:hypothetical protein